MITACDNISAHECSLSCVSVCVFVCQDLYVDRPLPYLIGSQAFMEQEDVGLGDLSSDGDTLMAASSGASTLYCLYSLYVFV